MRPDIQKKIDALNSQGSMFERLKDIAQAVQMIRMSMDEKEFSHANHLLDAAMKKAGYYVPNADGTLLPVEAKIRNAKKLQSWRNEMKAYQEKIKELELIIEKLSPFEGDFETELSPEGFIIFKPINKLEKFKEKNKK